MSTEEAFGPFGSLTPLPAVPAAMSHSPDAMSADANRRDEQAPADFSQRINSAQSPQPRPHEFEGTDDLTKACEVLRWELSMAKFELDTVRAVV